MNKDIYIVISYSKRDLYNTGVKVNQECYSTQEQAIQFCKSKLTEEQNNKVEKMKKRNLLNWYEFPSDNCFYEIEILSLKKEVE